MLRTHTCGELRAKDGGKKVTLCGWVNKVRSQAKMSFVDLRDRYGITQLFFSGKVDVGREDVIRVTGTVAKKPQPNPNLPTGEIEVRAESHEILGKSEILPLDLDDITKVTEDTRLKYRFLDLRRKEMQGNIAMRHRITKAVRDFFDREGFLEIETPMLSKSTPEGARDYLVPSRIYPGKFFALPQSPQLYKQLSMVSGFDRYVQIARCFRDEDLRADRQPEFTQIDVEMSFVEEADVISTMEKMLKYVWKQALDVDIKTPFPRISYAEAMNNYRTDKPDLRKDKNDKREYAFVWVTDFPQFDYSEEEKRLVAMHHPFTSPKEEDLDLLEKSPEKVRARAYDIVLNGMEIGGGSIRNHRREVQMRVFRALGIGEKEAEEKFGFLLNAFRYGAPPHGGIAFGLDRLIAIMTGNDSIREVIMFPKNKDARDIMQDSPSSVDGKQLDELGVSLKK
jgi:aspartyl-tRNA synthetase